MSATTATGVAVDGEPKYDKESAYVLMDSFVQAHLNVLPFATQQEVVHCYNWFAGGYVHVYPVIVDMFFQFFAPDLKSALKLDDYKQVCADFRLFKEESVKTVQFYAEK